MSIRKCFTVWFLFSLTGVSAWARFDDVPGSPYTSARAASMGEAFLPVADDGASALFYNPAALAKLQGTHFEAINMQANMNHGFFSIAGVQESYRGSSLEGMKGKLEGNRHAFSNVGGHFFPNFYTRGFAFGVLANTQFGAKALENSQLQYRSLYQFIPTAGFGFNLAQGILRFGYAAHYWCEASDTLVVPSSARDVGFNRGIKEGSGIAHTAGLALTIPYKFLPAVNLVARHIGDTSMGNTTLVQLAKSVTGEPDQKKMSLDASFSISPKTFNGGNIHLVYQLRDALNSSDEGLHRRSSAGMEVHLNGLLALRAGFRSGYPSAGLGIRGKHGELSFGWFSEDIDPDDGVTRDTKYILQYQLRGSTK